MHVTAFGIEVSFTFQYMVPKAMISGERKRRVGTEPVKAFGVLATSG